jgi:deoxyribodipyrimidine photo-lyase
MTAQQLAAVLLALTYAPVPSFAKFKNVAELHPYPWLRSPHAQSIRSFSAWRGKSA